MLIKKYLGQTMAEMGFVTRQQLDEALQRQKQMMSEKILHERLQRDRLVTEARLSKDTDVAPLLGHILTEMGIVTKEQLKQALKEQEKSFEASMSLETEKLGIIIEIGSLVNSTFNLAEVLYLIMKHVNRVTNSVASTLMLVDNKTGELVFSVPTGPKADKLIDIRIPPGEGIAGWVAEQEQPVLVPNVKEDTRFYPKIDEISGFETKSILCVPLKAKTKLIGVLEVINKLDGSGFSEEDELLLSMFGYQAAVAIENARLYGELLDQLEECKRAEEALRESEEKHRLLFESMRSGAVYYDTKGKLLLINPKGAKDIGIDPKDFIGKSVHDILNKELADLVWNRIKYTLNTKEISTFEDTMEIGRGVKSIVSVYNPVLGANKEAVGVQIIANDITERKQAEEKIKASLKEKEVLLQEIHHRVKNNMQIISSLLRLQASGVGDERVTDALMECRGRVQTMAFVHETLYGSDTLAVIDFKTYISKVASQTFQTYKTGLDRIKLEVDAEGIKLGIEQATPLGLITNELVTNSLKYAFPENRSGEIVIRIQAVEQDSIEFVFSDNGIGIPEGLDWRNTDSLGLQLVILLAEDQLDGSVSLDQRKGTHFTVRFRHKENQ